MTAVEAGGGTLHAGVLERLVRVGGQDLLIRMIELYLEHAPGRMDAIRRAVESGDGAALYQAAHSLKGTAGNLGAIGLQEKVERLERAATDADTAAARSLLGAVEELFEEARVELVAERDRRQGGSR